VSSALAEFFDTEAVAYDRAYDDPGPPGRVLRLRLEAAVRGLADSSGEVLDAGMGSGRLCAELDRRGFVVSGVDVSEAMVELAKARLPHRTEHLTCARIESLPFPADSFDNVVATGVLEYADDLRVALGELARVLRPGGQGAISFPNYRAPHNLWRRRVLYPGLRAAKRVLPFGRRPPAARRHSVSLAQFARAVESAGLVIRHAEPVGTRPNPGRLGSRQVVYTVRKA
jgi:SAM-dependent methyltransferase